MVPGDRSIMPTTIRDDQMNTMAAGTSDGQAVAKCPNAKKTWVEIQLVDGDGQGVGNTKYKLKLPDGSTKEGTLDGDGLARVDDIDEGMCEVSFPTLDKDAWMPLEAGADE